MSSFSDFANKLIIIDIFIFFRKLRVFSDFKFFHSLIIMDLNKEEELRKIITQFDFMKIINKNYLTKSLIFVLNKKQKDECLENQAILIVNKQPFPEDFKIQFESVDMDVFHTNPPFYKFYTLFSSQPVLNNIQV